MFERPRSGERAVLVHLELPAEQEREALDEFRELVRSAGAEAVAVVTGRRDTPQAKFFVGTGKAEEIRACVEAEGAEVVLFNHALSPAQERNLEEFLKCRVLDRTGLILDIFAQRARSSDGKLQVELAQMRHIATRLVRGWTHLERQKGGIGLRGPGETQLETDRRLVGERIKQLNRRLQKVTRQREQGRQARGKAEIPTVSLVGYTNAGKSTLFNALSGAAVYAADKLFATLDPTLRRIELPHTPPLVLADTVGFIRHLPHDLVAAFRSTLQETREASLLLHVIDAHADDADQRIAQVNQVLQEIDAEAVPQIEVYNKIDLTERAPHVERNAEGRITRVWLSAASGAGMDLLRGALTEYFQQDRVHGWLRLPPQAGRLRARLFDLGAVMSERIDEQGDWMIEVDLQRRRLLQLQHSEGLPELA